MGIPVAEILCPEARNLPTKRQTFHLPTATIDALEI